MKSMKLHVLVILVATFFTALPHPAMAHGLGVAVEGGWGRIKTNSNPGPERSSYDQDRFGIGMVYDTNVGGERLFNYRLGVSYQKMKGSVGDSRLDMDGFAIENDFGFRLFRNDLVRLWAGPAVRVEYLEGDGRHGPFEYYENTVNVGLGPVVGLNYNLGNDLSLILRGGYMFEKGVHLFTEWDERFGFLSLGLVMRMGE